MSCLKKNSKIMIIKLLRNTDKQIYELKKYIHNRNEKFCWGIRGTEKIN